MALVQTIRSVETSRIAAPLSSSPDLRAFAFADAAKYVQAAAHAKLDDMLVMSLAVLCNPGPLTSLRNLVSKVNKNIPLGGWHLRQNANNGLDWRFWRATTNGTHTWNNCLKPNAWQWVCGSFDYNEGTGTTSNLWVADADRPVLREATRTSAADGSGTRNTDAGYNLTIGNESFGLTLGWPGWISVVAIWRTARYGAGQFQQFIADPEAFIIKSGTECVGFWRLGHNGWRIEDESPLRAGPCTISGAVPTSAGMSGFWRVPKPGQHRMGNVLASVSEATATASAQAVTADPGVAGQLARPTSDVSDGNWLNEVGSNVNLYASIDETSPNDADYIESPSAPNAEATTLGLDNTLTTPGAGDVTLRVRALRT